MKWLLASCLILAWLPAAAADNPFSIDNIPDFEVKPATRTIMRQLREGGFVLFIRHAKTDLTHPDQLPRIDLNDCSTQRQLTDAGRREAAKIGRKIRQARIPVGEIYSSPICRAKDTALAAFGKNIIVDKRLMFTSSLTDAEKTPIIEYTRQLISTPVEGRTNRVVVAHAENLMEIMNYLPKPEGVVVILQPQGDKHFKYIASVAPDQWKYLIHGAGE